MIPRDNPHSGQYNLFKKRTDEVAHKDHPLVILSRAFNGKRKTSRPDGF